MVWPLTQVELDDDWLLWGEACKLLTVYLYCVIQRSYLRHTPGLKITASHRTIRNLMGQIFYSPVMLTHQNRFATRNKHRHYFRSQNNRDRSFAYFRVSLLESLKWRRTGGEVDFFVWPLWRCLQHGTVSVLDKFKRSVNFWYYLKLYKKTVFCEPIRLLKTIVTSYVV